MKFFYIAIFTCFCLCCSQAGLAQAVYGSTTLDIDTESNTVTATCETDADNYVAEYYRVDVSCVVEDSNKNIVASGGGEDDSGQGYVQAVVTFTGVPGETYTALSAHSVFAIFTVTIEQDPPQPIRLHYYDDIYDFSFYSDNPQTYDGSFEWDSPGPETFTATSHEVAGNTQDRDTLLKITYSGQSTDLVDTTQSAVTGQQMALTASYNLPAGVTVQSQSWSVPGTTVGGYQPSVSSGAPIPANFSQASTTYYWVDAGTSRTVTFTLNLTDGLKNWESTASVTFDVAGPTSPSMTAALNPGGVTIDLVGNNVLLEFGNNSTTFGIIFTPSVTQPSGATGTFSYIQLINSELEVITDPPASGSCTIGTGLDNFYPYRMRADGTAADSPAVSLNSTYTELVQTFSATMYLMWNSGLPNSIPVPLGSMQWGYSGDAYRDSISSIWSLRNPSDTKQAFTPGITYPQWTTHATNNDPQCH